MAKSVDKRCTLCGCTRIPLNRAGTKFGACTFIQCTNPLHDYDLERAAESGEAAAPPALAYGRNSFDSGVATPKLPETLTATHAPGDWRPADSGVEAAAPAKPLQHHCFDCGSTDPAIRLNRHAHMIAHMIPGWQNLPEICDDSYHMAAPPAPQASPLEVIMQTRLATDSRTGEKRFITQAAATDKVASSGEVSIALDHLRNRLTCDACGMEKELKEKDWVHTHSQVVECDAQAAAEAAPTPDIPKGQSAAGLASYVSLAIKILKNCEAAHTAEAEPPSAEPEKCNLPFKLCQNLRNAVAATDEAIYSDDQLLAQPGKLLAELEQARSALQTIADFAVGNGDVCEIIAKRARAALDSGRG